MIMKNIITKTLCNSFAFVLSFLTIYTVNSTCLLGLGQEKEPESLNKFKKLS